MLHIRTTLMEIRHLLILNVVKLSLNKINFIKLYLTFMSLIQYE